MEDVKKLHRRDSLRAKGAEVKPERHDTNPFQKDFAPPTKPFYRYVRFKGKSLVDEDTGDKLPAEMRITLEKDAGRFTKIAYDAQRDLGLLTSTARKVLDFVFHQLLPNNAVVFLPAAEAVEWCRFAQPKSFYDGVQELILQGYLAKTTKQSWYYTNHQRYFNGSRLKMTNEFKKPTHKS